MNSLHDLIACLKIGKDDKESSSIRTDYLGGLAIPFDL